MPEIAKDIPSLGRKATMPDTSAPLQANAARRYEVARAELPVSCPTPAMTLWNSHPRVYLPLEESGQAACPYCGAEFVLVDRAVD
jgi:uncharacterized Zn-finger protein